MDFFENEALRLFSLAILFSLILIRRIKIPIGIFICVITMTDLAPFLVFFIMKDKDDWLTYIHLSKLAIFPASLFFENCFENFANHIGQVFIFLMSIHIYKEDKKVEKQKSKKEKKGTKATNTTLEWLFSWRPTGKWLKNAISVYPATAEPWPFYSRKYRLASFSSCPNFHLHGHCTLELARNGFYYEDDRVLCYSCGHQFTGNMVESHDPDCRLMTTRGPQNQVARTYAELFDEEDIHLGQEDGSTTGAAANQVGDIDLSILNDSRGSPIDAPGVEGGATGGIGAGGGILTSPRIKLRLDVRSMSCQERQNSFGDSSWATGIHSPQNLAEHGLYLDGELIKCHICGISFSKPSEQRTLNLTRQSHSRNCMYNPEQAL